MFILTGTGSISADVVRDIMREADPNMSKDEIEQIIAETDADGSGEVDFEEFKEMMMGD